MSLLAVAASSAAADVLRIRDDAFPFIEAPVTRSAREQAILALDPDRISAMEVRTVLSLAPAPRIIALQGSIAFVTMQPFAEFLIAMGYPEAKLRNPRDGSLSYGSFGDSERLAGMLAWYYEHDAMMPMLIGHSQGGAMAMRVLHELAGGFHAAIPVWDPMRDAPEQRTTIVDPRTGVERPVVGLTVPYAAAIATGKLPRLLLGQWAMIARLRQVPDSVEDFSGFTLEWDPIAGNFPGSEPYRSVGSAHVRNITLPASASHITLPQTRALASDPITRSWIDDYYPGTTTAMPDAPNILHAADIWYSVKKHWCIEAQRQILARQATIALRNSGE
jgi:hypothetical protein